MNKKFEKVKRYYEKGLWTLSMVKNAVRKDSTDKKGWITKEEFETITGKVYEDVDA